MPKSSYEKQLTWQGRARRSLAIMEATANKTGFQTTHKDKSGLDEFMTAIQNGDLRIVAIEPTKTTINSDADTAVLENER